MKTIAQLIVFVVFITALADTVEARIFRRRSSSYSYSSTTADNVTVQAVCNENARMGRLRHLGGHAPYYEGIGCSSYSADAAIKNCCYWGQRQAVYIGTAQGSNGMWYACVRYH